jgi:uncharacterized membrane protein YdjX (TVP38/TMEM64 family)
MRSSVKYSLGFFLLIFALPLIWFLTRSIRWDIPAIQGWFSNFPPLLSAVLYVLLYVVITFFIFFSKDLFWLSGAFLFGPFLSAVLICAAELINAFVLFYTARALGRNYVKDKLSARYKNLDDKLGKVSLLWLFVFRAAPLIPYRFLDLAAGLTAMPFRRYIIAVSLGTPFKMFWIQYIIYAVGTSVLSDPQVLMNYFLDNKPLLIFSFIYIILVAMVLYKISKKE